MSESKHTPAPWYADHDEAADCPPHKNSGLAMIDTGRAGDWPIARLMEWNNVPIVLAAPDLLEACLSAVTDEKDDPCQYDHKGLCQAHGLQPKGRCYQELLRAAIAKATQPQEVSKK